MTPKTVTTIIYAWIEYQDHDHDIPGHMGLTRIADFSHKMANKINETEGNSTEKYFAKLGHHYNGKNNAERQAFKLIKEKCDQVLVSKSNLKRFFSEMDQIVDLVNQENPRCTDMKSNTWNSMVDQDMHYNIDGLLQIDFYLVREGSK
jgi:hypothetical protein